jgi:hypothetical protein
LKKAQAVVQMTSRMNLASTFFYVFSFFVFLMEVMSGKITTLKNCTKIEKEETHAHRKRARSALSREMTLELQQ